MTDRERLIEQALSDVYDAVVLNRDYFMGRAVLVAFAAKLLERPEAALRQIADGDCDYGGSCKAGIAAEYFKS